MSDFFSGLCGIFAKKLGKQIVERAIEASAKLEVSEQCPEENAEQLSIHEAAGKMADRFNLSCKPYRAPVMSRAEANGEKFFWTPLDVPGTARIQGYNGSSSILYVPRMIDGLRITEISFAAFDEKLSLKKVYLPDSVEKIGDCAFGGCENLEFVRVPNRKIEYTSDCFCRCPKLLKPEIRAEIAEISRRNLEQAKLEYELDDRTPYEAEEMERAPYDEAVYYVANGLVNLGEFDYRGNGTEETVRIPRKIGDINVTAISSYVFSKNLYVRRIYIPDTVKLIESRAFRECPNLEYVRLPDNPDLVFEENVFEDCPMLENKPLTEKRRRRIEVLIKIMKRNSVTIDGWIYTKPDDSRYKKGHTALISRANFGPMEALEWGLDPDGKPYSLYKWLEDEIWGNNDHYENITKEELLKVIDSAISRFEEHGFSEWVELYKAISEELTKEEIP